MSFNNQGNGAVQVLLRFRSRSKCHHLRPMRYLALLLVVLGLGSIFIQPAGAASGYIVTNTTNPVHTYNRPDPTSGIVRSLARGTSIGITCQADGKTTTVRHVSTNVWDQVTVNGAPAGFLSDYYASTSAVNAFSPGLVPCGGSTSPPSSPPAGPVLTPSPWLAAPNAVAAFAMAASQIGHTNSPAGHSWAGWCDNFVAFAYGLAHSGYATATDQYNDLDSRGLSHPGDVNPPLGALVFVDYWDTSLQQDIGHVAFSFGGGQLISTPPKDGEGVYVTSIAELSKSLTYRGWTYAYFRT